MKLGLIFCLFLAAFSARAQSPSGLPSEQEKQLQASELARYASLLAPATAASDWFDATSYEIRLTVTTGPNYLDGSVRVRGVVRRDSAQSLTLDLAAAMAIDSVAGPGGLLAVVRSGDAFTVTLDRTYHRNEAVDLTVYYAGLPVMTGFGSFVFSSHNGVPWIWSLSEPYGAKDWWPCKDNPADKADSVDVYVTCDSSFRVGSNGALRSVTDNGDGSRTHHWHEGYPIATYLVSVAMTDYASFSNWFVYAPGDSMEVLNYVLPEHLTAALAALPKTVDMLRIFSDLFGLYPFIHEKYGHADFGWGGAMEHQTMTSTTTYDESVVSHELGHQWFGDLVTCRNWPHLWLNEGFAQYSTALYFEQRYGTPNYWNYMNTQLNAARSATGPLVLADTSTIGVMFTNTRVYSKGSVVLHMLRRVIGDSAFFRSLRSYAADPSLAYASATTDDFRVVCEAVSGAPLGYFFSEWAYGENYPQYNYSWSAADTLGGSLLRLRITQSTGTATPAFFTMPMEIKISDALGDTVVRVWNDQQAQDFSWLLPRAPSAVVLDPGNWILKTSQLVTGIEAGLRTLPAAFRLGQNYPNPFNGETVFTFSVPERGHVTIEVWNEAGERVRRIEEGDFAAGEYRAGWNAGDAASGLYFIRAAFRPATGGAVENAVRKALLLR